MFSNNAIVTVFDKKPLINKDEKEYGFSCRISTSHSVKGKDGEPILNEAGKKVYKQDFGGWVKFVGKSYDYMKNKDVVDGKPFRVKVDRTAVESTSVKKEDGSWNNYYTFLVFECSDPSTTQNNADTDENVQQTQADDLPF